MTAATSSPFVARLWRLYRYFRGRYVPPTKPWAKGYVGHPKPRREALRVALAYARKGDAK